MLYMEQEMQTRNDDELRLLCLDRAIKFLEDSGEDSDTCVRTANQFFEFVKDGKGPDDD